MWGLGVIAVAAAIAVANAILPHGGPPPDTSRPGKPQLVSVSRTVRLDAERRRTINTLLDKFVPAAVERDHPLRALPLVTRAFRAGVTQRQWAQGKLPVMPYDARGKRFHGWTLNYSLAQEMSVDVLLRPGARETRGGVAFTATFKRQHGRWLIDAFIPAASFAPDNAKTSRILATPDFSPAVKGG